MYNCITINNESKNQVINTTLEVLRKGGLVVFPSDTVYGLLVDATNEVAVQKLIAFKNRPIGKAISVFVSGFDMLEKVVHLPLSKSSIVHHLLPGPFTVILESSKTTSKLLESEKGTLGVRIPQYEFVQELVAKFGKPITATSANLGGKSPHYSVESLLNQLPESKKELIDLIVDVGQLPRNKPSTVVDLSQHEMKLLRHGDIIFADESTYLSKSASQTQKLGRYVAEQLVKSVDNKSVVFILEGDLGSGKTILTKGIAEYFNITNIVSPTFVVYYEYDIENNHFKKLVHADLYNIEDTEEFQHLGLEEYVKSGNVMVIEWGEKLGDLYEKFKEKAKVVYISIIYKGEGEREIKVSSS